MGDQPQQKVRLKKLSRSGQAALYELAQLGRKLAEADSAKAVALATIEATRELFTWDSCWLGAWHEPRKEWEELIAFDLIAGVRQEVTAQTSMKFHSSSMTQRTIEDGPQLLHRRDEQDQAEATTLFGNGRRSLSLMFVPIRMGEQAVGILSIQSYQPDVFDRAALALLQTLADHCAGALARVRTRHQLDNSRLRFKKLFDAAPEAILLIATGEECGKILEANPAAEAMHGYAPGEMLGLQVQDLNGTRDRELFPERLRRLETGERLTIEVEHYRKDGSIFPLEKQASLIVMDGVRCILAFERDITERRQIEASLRASEKLAATGRMAAGIAHEINNPLNGIRASLILVGRAVPANHPDFQFVKRIEREIERIAVVTRRMFALYRPAPEKAQEFCLSTLVQDVVHFCQTNAKERGVELVCTLSETPCLVKLPEAAVSEVLYNLMKNAIEASLIGGKVLLELLGLNNQVLITIKDQGKGISEDSRERVFEPFFTTKTGMGNQSLGLGLAAARTQVEAMQGSISFTSHVNTGTAFFVKLPKSLLPEKILPDSPMLPRLVEASRSMPAQNLSPG